MDVNNLRQQILQKEYYQSIANKYDKKFKRENANHYYKIEQIENCILNHLLPNKEGYDILEIGGGTGIHALHFLENHKDKIKKFKIGRAHV